MLYTPEEIASGNDLNSSSVSQLTIASITVSPNRGQVFIMSSSVRGTQSISSADWNGESLTLLAANNSSGSECRAEVWYLLNPTPGTGTLTVNYAGNCYCIMGYSIFKNVNLDDPFKNLTSTDSNGVSANVTQLSYGGELAVDCISFWDNGYNDTPGNSDAYLYRRTWNTNASFSNRTWVGSSGEDGALPSVAFNWSCIPTSGRWAVIGWSFNPYEQKGMKMRYYRRSRVPGLISELDPVEEI